MNTLVFSLYFVTVGQLMRIHETETEEISWCNAKPQNQSHRRIPEKVSFKKFLKFRSHQFYLFIFSLNNFVKKT